MNENRKTKADLTEELLKTREEVAFWKQELAKTQEARDVARAALQEGQDELVKSGVRLALAQTELEQARAEFRRSEAEKTSLAQRLENAKTLNEKNYSDYARASRELQLMRDGSKVETAKLREARNLLLSLVPLDGSEMGK